MLVRCKTCRGAKKVMGLGCIQVDCKQCSGAGYVSIKEAIEEEAPEETKPKEKSKTEQKQKKA